MKSRLEVNIWSGVDQRRAKLSELAVGAGERVLARVPGDFRLGRHIQRHMCGHEHRTSV